MQNDSIIILRYQQQDTVPDNVSLVEEYYSNLNIKSKGRFINNLKDGEWKFWYKNGQLALIENYNNGRKVGLYQSWFESGQILEIVDYGK